MSTRRSARPDITSSPLELKDIAVKEALNFLQDHYYVKLSGSGSNADALLDQFARTLSARIGGTRTPPALLEKLPAEHRVQHSEQYMRKDPLGHAFLAPAYVATYAHGNRNEQTADLCGQ